jgi:hypothetical protein
MSLPIPRFQDERVVQIYSGPRGSGRTGSGYLISPNRVLTALHCVIDGDLVPDEGPVQCRIRPVGEGLLTGPEETWELRPAVLLWPPPGWKRSTLDIAVLGIDDQHATPDVLPVVTYVPKEVRACRGSGFPLWKQQLDKQGKVIGTKNYSIRGKLDPSQIIDSVTNPFMIDNGCPRRSEEWKGQSGTVLFDQDDHVAVAVVVERFDDADNCQIGAIHLRHLVDTATDTPERRRLKQSFWDIARLPPPIVTTGDLRKRINEAKSPRSYVHLFNRYQHIQQFDRSFAPLGNAQALPPIVVPIVGRRRDEILEMVRRFEVELSKRYPQRGASYRPISNPVKNGNGPTAESIARSFIEGLATALGIPPPTALDSPIREFATAIQRAYTPRAFRVEIRVAAPNSEAFIAGLRSAIPRLADFGRTDTPIIIFICVIATDSEGEVTQCDKAILATRQIAEAVTALTHNVEWIQLDPLKNCEADEVEAWSNRLAGEEWCDVPPFFSELVLHKLYPNDPDTRPTFALRKLVDILLELRSGP